MTNGSFAAFLKVIFDFFINGSPGFETKYIGNAKSLVDSANLDDAMRDKTAISHRPSDNHSSMVFVVPSEMRIFIFG